MHGFFSMATFPPPVIRLLGALKMLTHLDHRLALIKHSASLPQLTSNLLRGVMPSLHIVVLLAHKGNRGLTTRWLRKAGSGHNLESRYRPLASIDGRTVWQLVPG